MEQVKIEEESNNEIIWTGSRSGQMTMKEAYVTYIGGKVKQIWVGRVWEPFLPPKISIFAWKLIMDRLPTSVALKRRNVIGGDPISLQCISGEIEYVEHILIHCKVARKIWKWLSQTIEENLTRIGIAKEMV